MWLIVVHHVGELGLMELVELLRDANEGVIGLVCEVVACVFELFVPRGMRGVLV